MSRKTKQKRAPGTPAGGNLRHGLGALVRSRRTEIFVCLGLAIAVLLVFAQVAGFDFVNLDDPRNVAENPAVRNGLTLDGVVWAFTDTRLDYWHPITWLSHMVDAQLFGMRPGAHHLTSVFIHILNAILVFVVLRRMTGAVWRSATVAALFAIHPLRAESVAWVTERKDVLGGMFWWLATWAYVEYAKHAASWRRYGLVVVLFVMGLMAKPVVMTLPFFLLLLDYWPLKRSRGQSTMSLVDTADGPHAIITKPLLREKIPLFALSGLFVVFTFQAQHATGATEWMGPLPFSARLANSVVAYATYLMNAVWPYPLAAIYPYNRLLPAWQVAAAALLLAAVTALVVWKAARLPYLAVGWFWYLGVLVPVIGLVQLGFQARADRFTYTALTGVFVMLVWLLHDLMAKWRHRRAAAIAIAAVILPALAVRAWSQVSYWHDSIALFRQNLTVRPHNALALNSLGTALAETGRTDEALACVSEAVRLNPTYARARNSLGNLLLRKGRVEEAVSNLSEAIRLQPDLSVAHSNLANAFLEQGRFPQAAAEYAEALRLGLTSQDEVEARTNLGVILSKQGKAAEAAAQYSAALELDPSSSLARRNLAVALMKLGRIQEARTQLSLLLSVDPGDQEARDALNQLAGSSRGVTGSSSAQQNMPTK
jgi:tetratricopeptide (TPR) repeat protein